MSTFNPSPVPATGLSCHPATPEDMPKLFKKFDKDGNGDLEMEEFCAARQVVKICPRWG